MQELTKLRVKYSCRRVKVLDRIDRLQPTQLRPNRWSWEGPCLHVEKAQSAQILTAEKKESQKEKEKERRDKERNCLDHDILQA